ncbi:MAG: outer membrane protein, partial [Bacteroidetes bacterium]|nr:outer membrane protein [Bacteroidota bacterium]
VNGISDFAYHTKPQITLSYQQPLSATGIRSGHSDLEQSQQAFFTAGLSHELQKQQLILSVVQAYFQLWQSYQFVEQSEREFASAARILGIGELKLKSGTISEFEVLNLRVQTELANDNLQQTRNSLKSQRIAFLRLLGADSSLDESLVKEIPVDTIQISWSDAVSNAMKNRLELKQAESSITTSYLNRDQTASSVSPILRMDFGYSLSSLSESRMDNALGYFPNYGWNSVATLSFPITDGGRVASLTEIAERSILMQKKNLELMKQEIAIEIETRLRTLELNLKRIRSLTLSLEASFEALKATELRFQSGQITSTEIENVRNRNTASQTALNSARISYIMESAGLAKSMGQLFQWIETLKEKP